MSSVNARLVNTTLFVAFGGLAILYSLVIPAWEATDEPLHFAYAAFIRTQRQLPTDASTVTAAHHPPLYYGILAAILTGFKEADLAYQPPPNPDYGWGDLNRGGPLAFQHHWEREAFPYDAPTRALHLARLLSAGLGVLAVYGALRLGQEFYGPASLTATAVGATFAFVPSFLVSAATVHPDVLVSALGTLALWRLVALARRPTIPNAAVAGTLIGLMALSKASGLVFMAVAPLALLREVRNPLRFALLMVVCGGTAGLLAGPWLIRNQLVHGDFLGWGALLATPAATPTTTIPWLAIVQELAVEWTPQSLFWHTLILAFGHGDLYGPDVVYSIAYITLLSAAALLLLRRPTGWMRFIRSPEILVLLSAFAGMALATAQFGANFSTGAHGRYLFPALLTLALVLVAGFERLPGRLSAAAVPPLALLSLSAAAPFVWIAPAYGVAGRLPGTELPPANVDATFGGVMSLHRADAIPGRGDPGGIANLQLTWRALAEPGRSYRVFVHLVGQDGKVAAQVDRVPGVGRASTGLWREGDAVTETIELRLPASPGVYSIQTGFYSVAEMARLPAVGRSVAPGEVAVVGAIKVLGPNPRPGVTPVASFGNQFGLLQMPIPRTDPNGLVSVDLEWVSLAASATSYTVSVQALSADGRLIGQADSPPLGGNLPTTSWEPGDYITETVTLQTPAGLTDGMRAQVVIYDPASGHRLDTGGRDALDLGLVQVAR